LDVGNQFATHGVPVKYGKISLQKIIGKNGLNGLEINKYP